MTDQGATIQSSALWSHAGRGAPLTDHDPTLDLLTLALLPELGPRVVRELLSRAPLGLLLARPDEHGDLIKARAREQLRGGQARGRAVAEADRAERLGVRLVGLTSPDYPPLLLETYDPPPVLYVSGRIVPQEGRYAVAVVGSRHATPQGLVLARAMARELAAAGATIVSGLARGIDREAHLGALEARGRTVAVLGSALDAIYPPEHAGLGRAIVEGGGALVSEFPFGTGPRPGHFPRRNRVIAGWGPALVVVEAAARSGALVTARCALDAGREVLAVPGHPSAPQAEGTNALIRDGAALVRGAEDVARELGLVMAVTRPPAPSGDDVLDSLRADTPMTLEELVAASGKSTKDLLAKLTVLELGLKVRRLPGPLYLRN